MQWFKKTAFLFLALFVAAAFLIPSWRYYMYVIPLEARQYYLDRHYITRHPDRIYTVNQKKFRTKMEKPCPDWVVKIIDRQLKCYPKKTISQAALLKTYQTAQENGYVPYRYRIRGNQLYAYVPDQGDPPYTEMHWILSTLIKLIHNNHLAPFTHLDFLVEMYDGVPIKNAKKNGWIVEDPALQAPLVVQASLNDAPHVLKVPAWITMKDWHLLYHRVELAGQITPWEKKKRQMVWRGGRSDLASPLITADEITPRQRLCEFARQRPQEINAGFYKINPGVDEQDILHLLKPWMGTREQISYAYAVAVDGVMCAAPGHLWKLMSNSVVFKQDAPASEWWYPGIEPYVHYIPVRFDLADLEEKLQWAKENDAQCKQIAENATRFVKENLMVHDFYAYIYRLLKAYENCLEPQEDSMDEQINWRLIFSDD